MTTAARPLPATKAARLRHATSTREGIMRVREAMRSAVDLLDEKPKPVHWFYELHDEARLVWLDRFTLMCRVLLLAAQSTGDADRFREMRAHIRVALAEQERAVFCDFEQCDDRPLGRVNATIAEEFSEALTAMARAADDPSPSNRATAQREVAEAIEAGKPVLSRLAQ